MNEKMDFVIAWVDGGDTQWQQKRNEYWAKDNSVAEKDANNNARFRDWDNLKYWFRAVDKYAPWVNKIHFVTCGQIPEWMNIECEKLNIVNHSDYIPENYLPTFNSHTIELNFNKIRGLTDNFVYFNDDMFLTNNVEPSDFFVNGKQREQALLYALINDNINDSFSGILFSNLSVVNDKFNLSNSYNECKSNWTNRVYGKRNIINLFYLRLYGKVPGLEIPHAPSALKKSTYNEVWDEYYDVLDKTCSHRFRTKNDVNQYVFREWEIMKNNFYPTLFSDFTKCFYLQENKIDELCHAIENRKYKMICINDSMFVEDFDTAKNMINISFKKTLQQKSIFEK